MLQLIILYAVTAVLLIVSAIVDRKKTLAALKKGAMMFLELLPSFLSILILVSVALVIVGPQTIQNWLGGSRGLLSYGIAALLGSIALIPGFVAYPMSAILIKTGIGYPVISVFITTLMMVGIVTLPLEVKFFGWKVAVTRNVLSFLGALCIGAMMVLVWSFL